MKKIKINGFSDASEIILASIKSNNQNKTLDKLNVAFTGGRFGDYFSSNILEKDLRRIDFRLFLTDERYTSNIKVLNKTIIEKNFIHKLNNNSEFYFFDTKLEILKLYKNMSDILNKLEINFFDIVILSLGEDGHLAGHFNNSILFRNGILCKTDIAPISPRISFSVEWLLKAKNVFIVIKGKEKQLAYDRLLSGNGVFDIKAFERDDIIFLENI